MKEALLLLIDERLDLKWTPFISKYENLLHKLNEKIKIILDSGYTINDEFKI